MRCLRRIRHCGLAALIGNAAVAGRLPQASSETAAVQADPAPKSKSPPNFDAMLGFVDKLFPPQPDPDPARLALARTSVQAMWPDGAYGKMMSGFMGGMFDRAMQLKTSDLAALANKPKSRHCRQGLSLHEQVGGKDPYFDQRMAAMRDALDEEIGEDLGDHRPAHARWACASDGAPVRRPAASRHQRLLRNADRPRVAGQYMQLWLDPDTMRSMFMDMPEMMKLMPEMTQKMKAIDDQVSKPAKPKDDKGKAKP